jgi:hypothetical protein
MSFTETGHSLNQSLIKKAKAVPLHAMEALGGGEV